MIENTLLIILFLIIVYGIHKHFSYEMEKKRRALLYEDMLKVYENFNESHRILGFCAVYKKVTQRHLSFDPGVKKELIKKSKKHTIVASDIDNEYFLGFWFEPSDLDTRIKIIRELVKEYECCK